MLYPAIRKVMGDTAANVNLDHHQLMKDTMYELDQMRVQDDPEAFHQKMEQLIVVRNTENSVPKLCMMMQHFIMTACEAYGSICKRYCLCQAEFEEKNRFLKYSDVCMCDLFRRPWSMRWMRKPRCCPSWPPS